MSVTAIVQHHDTPPVPPELAPFIEKVTVDATEIGYRLDLASVLSHAGQEAYGARANFLRWRESFAHARDLGSRTLVESARSIIIEMAGAQDEYLGVLQETDFSLTTLSAEEAEILVTELHLAMGWVAQSDQKGWGLVDASAHTGGPPRRGLLAAGVALAGQTVVAAAGDAEVRFEQGRGLFVREAGNDLEVAEFVLTGTTRTVRNAAGEFRVSDDASRALSRLAPTATAVRVVVAPLTSVFADFLVGLDEVGRFAVANTLPMVVTDRL